MALTDELLELGLEMAYEAGELLRSYARQRFEGVDIGVGTKVSATDPVSDADRAAERLISERLAGRRPDDGLLGEEGHDERAGSSGLRWVVDPLDGTVNFLYGQPTWSVSIACEDEQGALVGIVHHPDSGETFHAVRGQGAHLGGRPLTVTPVEELGHSLVATGFAYDPTIRAWQGQDLADLVARVRDVRRTGSAALDLAWCAAGRVDGYLEFGLFPWDWAAGGLLVTEAGGVVTPWQRHLGERMVPGLVAGGRAVHDHLERWLETRP